MFLRIYNVVSIIWRFREKASLTLIISMKLKSKIGSKIVCRSNATNVSKELYSLACGSDALVAVYQGCIVNDVRFHTKDREHTRRTQSSGVFVSGKDG